MQLTHSFTYSRVNTHGGIPFMMIQQSLTLSPKLHADQNIQILSVLDAYNGKMCVCTNINIPLHPLIPMYACTK